VVVVEVGPQAAQVLLEEVVVAEPAVEQEVLPHNQVSQTPVVLIMAFLEQVAAI
jgi:hypothetical protein